MRNRLQRKRDGIENRPNTKGDYTGYCKYGVGHGFRAKSTLSAQDLPDVCMCLTKKLSSLFVLQHLVSQLMHRKRIVKSCAKTLKLLTSILHRKLLLFGKELTFRARSILLKIACLERAYGNGSSSGAKMLTCETNESAHGIPRSAGKHSNIKHA